MNIDYYWEKNHENVWDNPQCLVILQLDIDALLLLPGLSLSDCNISQLRTICHYFMNIQHWNNHENVWDNPWFKKYLLCIDAKLLMLELSSTDCIPAQVTISWTSMTTIIRNNHETQCNLTLMYHWHNNVVVWTLDYRWLTVTHVSQHRSLFHEHQWLK